MLYNEYYVGKYYEIGNAKYKNRGDICVLEDLFSCKTQIEMIMEKPHA